MVQRAEDSSGSKSWIFNDEYRLMKKLIAVMVLVAVLPTMGRTLDGIWEFRREGASWTKVTVPHDWGIAPFDPEATGDCANSGKLPWKGRGVYRRTFVLTPEEWKTLESSGKAYLSFDGVQAHPSVTVNGHPAGGWDYGYMSFTLDVGELLTSGENLVEVAADTTKLFSRWYPGAGIYRSVHLVVKPKNHVVPGTMKIVAEPSADFARATVNVSYVSSLYGPTNSSFVVEKPRLWSVEKPELYELEALGEKFTYGIRTMKFTADDGFWLNGRRLQLKGVCLHSDFGPLGMVFDETAAKRQLRILKDMGVNAIRTSHNAPAAKFLDLCDRMGFVVWDECFDKWDDTMARGTANLEEYVCRNLKAFVRRDRNHPCVAAWSIGNEMPISSEKYPSGVTRERCRMFREAVRSEDVTRPVGIAAWEAVTVSCFADLDLTGWNYAQRYMPMKAAYPDKPIVYTESCSSYSEIGFFQVPPAETRSDIAGNVFKTDGFDMTAASYSDIPDVEFYRMEKDRFVAGEFVWTGFDYIGEPSPYNDYYRNDHKDVKPSDIARSSYYGIVDLTGVPKDRYYLYRAHWNTSADTLHLLPHWNWKAGEKVPAFVYSSGDEVELLLNGRSLGRRRKAKDVEYPLEHNAKDNDYNGRQQDNPYYRVCDKYRFRWYDIPFEPGELKAVAYKGGRKIGETVRRTAGEPSELRLAVDPYTETSDDLVYVRVTATDEKGVPCPLAMNRVSFGLEGNGEIVSVGNGNPRGFDSFKDVSSHPLYYGQAMVIVRRTRKNGKITLAATADGFRMAKLSLGF